MTAKNAKSSEQDKKAGTDESKNVQTTKEDEQNAPATKVEERGETDAQAAAGGGSVGAVNDGDVGGGDEVQEEFESYDDGEVAGSLGAVAERNLDGDEYDAPWAYITGESAVIRTSDSDDPGRDWTAQHAGGERKDADDNEVGAVALTPVQATPGQTFRVSELPNVDVMRAAGINVEQFLAGVPVRADIPNEAPRRGIPA